MEVLRKYYENERKRVFGAFSFEGVEKMWYICTLIGARTAMVGYKNCDSWL